MGVFRQLGDPLAGAVCLCQHHGAAYAEYEAIAATSPIDIYYYNSVTDSIILQQQIVTTERCCINVNAALATYPSATGPDFTIERPLNTIRTTQESHITTGNLVLHHYAAWEVLDAGTYTYYLMQRAGHDLSIFAVWLKIIASDCEG